MFYTEDNAVAVVKKAIKHHKIRVSSEKIIERLTSHPNYPSLKSICDSLEEWNVQYYAARLDINELRETGAPFIAHLYEDGEKLAFIPKLENTGYVEIFDTHRRSRTLKEEEFIKKYSGISVLLDPNRESGEGDFAAQKQNETVNRSFPILGLLAIGVSVIYMLLNASVSQYPGLAIKAVGLALSLVLFIKSLNIRTILSDLVCGKGANCNSILNSSGSKVFGWLHWTEVGLIYFVSTFFVQAFTGSAAPIIGILAFFGTGFIPYSIYYQWRVAKTWCVLCLSILLVLAVDASYYAIRLDQFVLPVTSLLEIVFIFLLVGFSVMLYKGWFISKQMSNIDRIKFLRLKRNPLIFKQLLQSGKKIFPERKMEVFTIGNPAASIGIDAFLNLKCQPCRDVFDQLSNLAKSVDVRINLWFVMTEKDAVVITKMRELMDGNDSENLVQFVKTWYKNGIVDNRNGGNDNLFRAYEKAHYEQFKHYGVEVTPTIFVGGYKLPSEYQVRDLGYLIEALKE